MVRSTKSKGTTGTPAKKTANVGTPLPFAPRAPARPFVDPEAKTVLSKKATLADVKALYKKPAVQSPSNVLGDPTQNLQTFTLENLAQFTKEATYSTDASKDVHLFYVGRDDVHDILKYILSRVTISLYLNMFGFDDSELNNIIMQKALNPAITMLITLDKSQSNGVHEKALLEADQKYNLAAYNTHFAVGESETNQISHTKGFVADGRVAAEGSTNWSSSGEGTFVANGQPGGPNYKAQNNTQSVITDRDTIVRFQTELIAEHMTAKAKEQATGTLIQKPFPLKPTSATAALQKQAEKTAAAKKAAAKRTLVKKRPAKKTVVKNSPAKKTIAKKIAAKTAE
jgi:hypothetical protein